MSIRKSFGVTAAMSLAALAGAAHSAGEEFGAEQVVRAQCINCHGPGLNGAPRIGDREAWLPRLTQGLDSLVHYAIRGHGGMPPRGGMPQLTDEEFRAAVVYLFSSDAGLELASNRGRTAQPADPYRRSIDGTEIHVGVAPAYRLQRQGHMAAMHGGIPGRSGFYHVNVSLHEAEGAHAQIRDATVEARVANALSGETKRLEPMEINGTTSYGNYFRLAASEPYTVTVTVQRAGGARPIEARFPLRR